MSHQRDWEDEWRAVFANGKNSAEPTLPTAASSPTNALPPSLAHTLERVFRSYSLVSDESGIRVMPAASFVRMASDCCFVDDHFTHKHLYQIISIHAGQLVNAKGKGMFPSRTRRRTGDADSDDRLDGRAGLTFADFTRALQEIGEAKMGAGKNGLHRLVYLNIIRFANLEGSAKSTPEASKNLVPPKARRDGLQDALLRLVLESSHTGVSTVQTRELLDDCKSKWSEVPKTGKEIHLVKKQFAAIFMDVTEAFIFFDLQGNDFISMHEFRRGMQRLKLTDVNTERLVREVDLGCMRRNGEDIDLISFIRLFAWHPVKELTEWVSKYERTKLSADVIVDRIRESIKKRSGSALPADVDLDLITACSVLGTKWDEVRKAFLATGSSKRSTPSPPRSRRSTSPSERRQSAWSEGLRSDGRHESLRSGYRAALSRAPCNSGRAINAIDKQDFLDAVTTVPLDLNHTQIQKAFEFLDVDKNGWFHVLQAEDVMRKAGYLPRVMSAKSSASVHNRSTDNIMQEMVSVECERTLALSALADQWASHELDLVNNRYKDRLQNVLTLEEQVRFDRATAGAQKSLTHAMEKQFSSIHQMFDERVRRLRMQLQPSPKNVQNGLQAHVSHQGMANTGSPLRIATDTSSLRAEKAVPDDEITQLHTTHNSNSSRASRCAASPGSSSVDKRMVHVEGAPSHSLQQSVRRKLRNLSRLKEQGWAELLRMFDGDSDGLLTHEEFTQALDQGCSQRQDSNRREVDLAGEANAKSKHNEHLSTDVFKVLFRMLDPGASGKVKVDAFLDFMFHTSAQQSPAAQQARSAKALISSHSATPQAPLCSPQESPSAGSFRKSTNTPFMSKVEGIGPRATGEGTTLATKSLDPWATQTQLNNVYVPGGLASQAPAARSTAAKMHSFATPSRAEGQAGKTEPQQLETGAAAKNSHLDFPIVEAITPEQSERRGSMQRSMSAPPRSNHTGKSRGMYFSKEAPGAYFRLQSPKKSKSPRRMLPTKFWETSDLSTSAVVHDASLGEFDSEFEGQKEEEQPISPKLLSARSPIISNIDVNETDGWIVSPVPPSPVTKKSSWPRSRQDRSGHIRHVIDTSSDTSSEERQRRRVRTDSPIKKTAKGRGYQEMQDKIRESLRREWGASESESDDAWQASVTDAVLKKQLSKKYNKLSPYGKQSALQILKRGGSQSTWIDADSQDSEDKAVEVPQSVAAMQGSPEELHPSNSLRHAMSSIYPPSSRHLADSSIHARSPKVLAKAQFSQSPRAGALSESRSGLADTKEMEASPAGQNSAGLSSGDNSISKPERRSAQKLGSSKLNQDLKTLYWEED